MRSVEAVKALAACSAQTTSSLKDDGLRRWASDKVKSSDGTKID